jgi:FHS family Na+ dependent glucose MFS transporter 1
MAAFRDPSAPSTSDRVVLAAPALDRAPLSLPEPPPTWLSWVQTPPGAGSLLYSGCYVALGLCISTIGPVLLDLAAQTRGTLAATGYCVIVRSFGYLCGSFLGPLYDKYQGHRLLAAAMASACVGTLGITGARSTAALGATLSLQGVAMGLIDTGANTLLLRLFEGAPAAHGSAAMQAMHCAFAVGAMAGPLLERAVESGAAGAGAGALVGEGTYNPAFFVVAALCAALCGVLLRVASPPLRGDASARADAAAVAEAAAAVASGKRAARARPGAGAPPGALLRRAAATPAERYGGAQWAAVRATAALLGVYVGAEAGFGNFVTAYSVIALRSSEATGQLLAGAYWAAITAGRFAAIWLATLVEPSRFLKASMAGALASALFMLFAWGETALWVGSVAFGLSMACIFPTTLSLLETFFPVRAPAGAAPRSGRRQTISPPFFFPAAYPFPLPPPPLPRR